jgi:hypothetical protein
MRVLGVVLAIGVWAGPAQGEVKVSLKAGRMDIVATRATVTEILDRVASVTGMKVIYDGPVPSKMITKSLPNRTPADAILGMLEGEGINFAVILNPAGTQVETLLVTGPSKVKPPPPAPAGAPNPDWNVEVEEPPAPPPPADQAPPPPPGAPANAPASFTPPPITLPTPTPFPSSPFTPQGAGPILLPLPGATVPPPQTQTQP